MTELNNETKISCLLNATNELTRWNFKTSAKYAKNLDEIPKNIYYHILSLANDFGDLGEPKIGWAFVRVLPQFQKILPALFKYLHTLLNEIKKEVNTEQYVELEKYIERLDFIKNK